MTKILLIKLNGMYTLSCESNRGSAGVVTATVQTLRQYIPDAEFTSLIQFSDEFARDLNIKVIKNRIFVNKNLSPVTMLTSTLNLLQCALWSLLRRPFPGVAKILVNNRILKAYAESDVIIDISMDLYNDSYIGALPVIEHSKEILTGVLLKKPVVIWAQSPGPFNSKFVAWLARYTLNRVAMVIVREEISLENMRKLGVTKPPIYLTADPAFLVAPASPERAREILLKEGLNDNQRPLVGLAMGWTNINWRVGARWYRKLLGPFYRFLVMVLPEGMFRLIKGRSAQRSMPNVANFSQIEETAKIVDYLVTDLNASVVLVPHDYTVDGDERILLDNILKRVQHAETVRLLTGDYSAAELKSVIALCDLFIGGKMHANIAATSMYVPTVAIQYKRYSQKFAGIMRLLGQEKYVCENLTFSEVQSKIREAWSDRQNIKMELKLRMEEIKEKARSNATLVINLLNAGKGKGQELEVEGVR